MKSSGGLHQVETTQLPLCGRRARRSNNTGMTQKPRWYSAIDQTIQHHIGTSEEFNYFSVMHAKVGKVLWQSPEEYEKITGNTLRPDFKWIARQ